MDAGVGETQIVGTAGFSLPEETFNPVGPSHSLDWWLSANDDATPFVPEKQLPVLGTYGKLGHYKGSGDLLHAMARLHADGFRFHLLAASHGWQEARYRKLVDHLQLTNYVHLIPFIPHWQIPSFIRSCTAVAFLERDFPITAHTPTIPLEVITCAGCLIVSAEVARKQIFRSHIRDLRNIIVVSDPQRHDELADRVRYALENGTRACEIGRRGWAELKYEHTYTQYVDELEELLTTVAGENPAYPAPMPKERQELTGPRDVITSVERFYPYTHALLNSYAEEFVRQALVGRSIGRHASNPRSMGLD